jgi:hypothetical protein
LLPPVSENYRISVGVEGDCMEDDVSEFDTSKCEVAALTCCGWHYTS